MTPKNLILLTISSSDISILIWTFVFIYFLLPNKITLVLLIFNDNLLTLIHSFNFVLIMIVIIQPLSQTF